MMTSTPATPEKNAAVMDLEEIVPEYYSQFALVRWLFNKRLALALSYVKRINPRTLLDAGCGDGSFVRLVNKEPALKGLVVSAMDINPRITRLQRNFPRYRFVVGSVLKTDFLDGSFDTAVALDVLEHLKDARSAALELKRVIKNGGHLITSEPVESFVYKSLRFLIKGTFSQESGPGASPHYHNARGIDRIIRDAGFVRLESSKIPLPTPLDLFHINLYQKT